MASRIYEHSYGTGARHRDRRRNLFSLGSKSTCKASSTQLRHPVVLSMRQQQCPFNVSFKTDDKLVIIFAYQKKFVVYKKSNRTVAILENVTFKQENPPTMFDGANLGALLHKLELKLMYAVAVKDFREPNGILFHQKDVVLILAHCREIFLGITEDHRVGFFPAETVNIITNPKACFFEGMTLTVTGVVNFLGEDQKELTVYEKLEYEITKGRDGLFDWFASNHLQVPLHAVSESGMTMGNNYVYQRTIPVYTELKPSPLKNGNIYCDRGREVAFKTPQKEHHSPMSKCAGKLESMYISRDEARGQQYSHQKQDTTITTYPAPPQLGLDPPPPLPPRNPVIQDEMRLFENSGGIRDGDEAEENRNFSDKESADEKELCYDPGRSENTKNSFGNSYSIEDSTDYYPPVDGRSNSEVYSQRESHRKVAAPFQGLGVVDHLEKQGDDRNDKIESSFYNSDEDSTEYDEPVGERSNFFGNKSANDGGLYYNSVRSERMKKNSTEDHHPVPAPRHQSLGKHHNLDAYKTDKIQGVSSTSFDSQTGIVKSTPFDTIPDNGERLHAVYRRSEDVKKQKTLKEREDLLQKLLPYREAVTNDQLRTIVAQSVDPDVLHDLCKQIKVPKNKLREIHDQKETIYEKTYDLLGIWQRKFGINAKVGLLLDALVEVKPEDLLLILEDILSYFEDSNVRDSGLYDTLPGEENLYALPKKAKDNKVKVFLNDLRYCHEEEFNDEMKNIVSLYIDEDVWHKLGESLEISKNTRRQIEKNKDDIFGKTFDLLDQWHQKFGSQATLGFLLEALVFVNPDDLYLILKDLSKYLDTLVYEDVQ